MGTVTFNTNVNKTVDIDKFVTLDVDKEVLSFVNLTGNLATAEASADAVGTFAGPIEEGFELVDSVGDLSRGEIHAEWWDRALNFPFPGDVLPFNEPTGALQGLGQDVPGVFLIDGTGGGGPVTRTFVVPFGDTLAIPLVNTAIIAFPGEPPPEEQIVPNFEAIVEESLFLIVDGEEIPLDTLLDTRAASGEFDLTVEPGGFLDDGFGLPVGETFDSAADGYLVLLEGLDPGPHTITFGGMSVAPSPIDVDVTINILVLQPAQGALAETDTFAQVTETGAFAFSESLAALSFAETDVFMM